MARGKEYQIAFALNSKLSGGFNKSFNTATKQMQNLARTAKATAGLALGAIGIKNTVGTAVTEAMNLEGFKMQLETATKSAQKAGEIMKWSIDLANKTPFETGSVVEASARLEAMGLAAKKYVPAIGDMAGATNKDLIQATEAVIDAQTGELERLKEFGIKKDDIAQYAYEKMGKIQVVNNKGQITNQEKFNEAMLKLMDEKFKGGMEKQAGTMKGLMSTISGIMKSGMASMVGITSEGTIKQGSLMDKMKTNIKGVADTLVKWQQSGAFERLGDIGSLAISKIIAGYRNLKSWVLETYGTIKAKVLQNQPLLMKIKGVVDDVKNAFINLRGGTSILDWLKNTALPGVTDGIMFVLEQSIDLYNFIRNNWSLIEPIVLRIGIALATWKVTRLIDDFIKTTTAIWGTVAAHYALIKAKMADKVQTVYLKALYLGDFLKSLLVQGKAILANAVAWTVNTTQLVAQKVGLIALKGVQLASKGVTLAMTAAQWALNAAFIASPIGWIVLGIGALIAIGVLLYKNWDTVKAGAVALWNTLQNAFGNIGDWIKLKWNEVMQCTVNTWTSIQSFLGTFPIGQAFLQNISNMVESIKTIFNGITDFITGVFTGNWAQAWEGVKGIFSGIVSGLGAIFKAPINAISGMINTLIGGLNKINIKIPDWSPIMGGKSFGINIPTIPMFAKGTMSTPKGSFIAGERGPELISGAPGRRVFTNAQTKGIASKNRGQVIQFAFSPNVTVQGGDSNVEAKVQQVLAKEKIKLFAEFKGFIKNQGRLAYEW
ncbi:MAG: hypothetical protein AB9856_03475 [Cellulosilyticaceae bacterium]